MPSVTFIQADGTSRTLDLPAGTTIMRGAVENEVPGILGDCGGSCVCATCHVYVPEHFAAAFPTPDDGEADLLDCVAAERRSTSRLGCQLQLLADHGEVVVHVPERQL